MLPRDRCCYLALLLRRLLAACLGRRKSRHGEPKVRHTRIYDSRIDTSLRQLPAEIAIDRARNACSQPRKCLKFATVLMPVMRRPEHTLLRTHGDSSSGVLSTRLRCARPCPAVLAGGAATVVCGHGDDRLPKTPSVHAINHTNKTRQHPRQQHIAVTTDGLNDIAVAPLVHVRALRSARIFGSWG